MPKLIVANWKMNPDSLGRAVSLAKRIDTGISKKKNIEVVIAPPVPYLSDVRHQISDIRKLKSDIRYPKSEIRLGAQDVFWENEGPYTGEVSPTMLKNLGVEYVIIGHSERRKFLRETDEMINKKVLASLKAGLKVILCVGEPAERGLTRTSRGLTRNKKSAKDYVRKQLESDLRGVGFLLNKKSPRRSAFGLRKSAIVVAYEPIWAISTSGVGKIDTPADATEMATFIKSTLQAITYKLQARVLYGGSVDSQNARSFVHYKGIDGALVGGASLKAEEFKKIIKKVSA